MAKTAAARKALAVALLALSCVVVSAEEPCYCECHIASPEGGMGNHSDITSGEGQLHCAACCSDDQLTRAMREVLPTVARETVAGRACNHPSGILSVFLSPTCWDVPEGASCQFPFVMADNQIVINCTDEAEHTGKEWCMYDPEDWARDGTGWGYCAEPKSAYETLAAQLDDVRPSEQDVLSDQLGDVQPNEQDVLSDQLGDVQPNAQDVLDEQLAELQNPAVQEAVSHLDKILANLTSMQQESLSAGNTDKDVISQYQQSGGLTPAGIAAVVVVCLLVVGGIVGAGFGVWRMRNRIKQRRESKFAQMQDEAPSGRLDHSSGNGEVSMTAL